MLEDQHARLLGLMHGLVRSRFDHHRVWCGLDSEALARRIGYTKTRVDELLASPEGWTIEAASDMLIGVSGECLTLRTTRL